MTCSTGIKDLVKKTVENKPWFKFNNKDFIRIMPSPAARINPTNFKGVANTLATYLNKGINNGIKIGDVFYPEEFQGVIGVGIRPTEFQLQTLNSNNPEELQERLDELAKIKREKDTYFTDREKEELKRGVDYNTSDEGILFNRDTYNVQSKARAEEIFTKVADKLSSKLGVDYKIITPEEAVEITKDSPIQYNGEGAFAYKGRVYILNNRVTLENGIHEFGHFLVSAVVKDNPGLFTKLYNDFLVTSSGAAIDAQVRKNYSDFSENEIQQEVITRGLTQLAQGKIEDPKNVFQRFWFAIKQILRNIFGKEHKLSNLNENTTLDQLAEMLVGDNLKINTEVVYEDDVIKFNRDAKDFIDDFKKLDNSNLNKAIERFDTIVKSQIKDVLGNSRYKDIKETLTGDSERNDLLVVRDILKRASEAGDDIEGMNKKAVQLAHTIDSIDMFTTKILDRIRELNDMEDHKERLGILSSYQFLLGDWARTMEQFGDELRAAKIPAGSALYSTISSVQSKLNSSLKEITDNNEEAVFDLIKEMLQNVKEDIKKEHDAKVALYKKDIEAGNTSARKLLDEENNRYKRFDLNDDTLRKYLRGEMGDTNQFSGYLEAYISSPDPIVGGFAKFLKTAKYEVEVKARKFSQDFRTELDPLYKKLNVDRSNPAELGKQLTFMDSVLKFEDGKPVQGQVISLINPFKNYRYDLDLMNYQIDKAKSEGREEDARQLRKELNQHLSDYFYRDYVDEYYKLQDIWKSENGTKAYQKRSEVYEQISDIQDTLSNDPIVREQQLEEVKLLRKQVQLLGSLRDENGDLKTGEDLAIAQVIQEYNKQSRQFYEWNEIKGLFETRFNEFKQGLLDEGLNSESPEFKEKTEEWKKQNTRRVISPEFYDTRKKIIEDISKILNSLPDSERKNLDIERVWKDIIDIVTGNRDENGQPIGSNLNERQITKIKEFQQKIQEIKEEYNSVAGLTKSEAEELSYYYEVQKNKSLSEHEYLRMNQLINQKGSAGLTKLQKNKLVNLMQQLKDLQSKVATDYYVDIVNNHLSKANIDPITETSAEVLLEPSYIDKILAENPEFKEWFHKNHLLKEYWDNKTKSMVNIYERLYVWNRIEPNNENHYQKYTLSDGTKIDGLPTFDYYRRVVKSEYRTKKEVGKTIDNKGNWLPKTIDQGAKDSKYINERYNQLKSSNPDMFSLLGVMTKYHLKAQEGIYSGNKLGYDIPRFHKSRIEYLRSGQLKDDVSDKAGQLKEGIGQFFSKRADDYSTGNANYENELTERLATSDMFDNEISRIPIKGLASIPVEQVSLNVGESIIKYMTSAETNKKLIETSPYAKALLNVLEENGVKDITAINRKKWMSTGVKTFINSSKNRRHQILSNLYEREFLGIEHHNEMGEFANKAANTIMSAAAWGTLAVDLPGSVKNVFAANVQSFIESLAGKHINKIEFAKGTSLMTSKYIPALIADYNKLSGQSLYTQMYQMFDPQQGKFYDKLGHELKASNLSNFVAGHWAFAPREFGEIEAQGSFWLGMMMHTKIDQTINGETKQINYQDAFELVDGKVQLKQGIDPEWAEGGKKFLEFKLKLHELNQKLQGNYSNIDQPEMQRYTYGRLLNFMRRYFVPAAVNRFSKERIQVGMGGTREGYYTTSLRVASNFVKTAKLNWHLYTDEEKANVWKTLGEVGISLTFYLLLRSLGWDPNDKDKYKKLKDNSWATNQLIYQLMAVKSESEQFIPVPGMGADEIMRLKNTPSLAFGHLDKYYRLINDATDLIQVGVGMEDSEKLRYTANQGIWEKGDLKVVSHLARIVGFTGTTISPDVAIKNMNMIQSRTK